MSILFVGVLQAMQEVIEGERGEKFYLYSGHDNTGTKEIKICVSNLNTYLLLTEFGLLTEFEVRTVSYGPRFSRNEDP